MLNVINDIISISKIESGIIDIHLSFSCTLPESEAIITTDGEKFYRILSNLVKNAIKYTQKGTIEFGYIFKGENVEFYVKDTGIGIPKEKIEVVFERFIQADITDKMARQGVDFYFYPTGHYFS